MAFSSFCRRRLSLFLPFINHNNDISFTTALHSENTQLGLLPFTQLLLTVRSFSSISTDKQSFTISYLINSCGLSPQSAKFASKYVLFDNPSTPDSVLRLLRNYGFTDDQISEVVRKTPILLQRDADKTISPKLQYLRSVGLSSDDLSTLMAKNRGFLTRSLKQFLIPLHHILNCSLSDQDVFKAFKRLTLKTLRSLSHFNANLSALREIGMPRSTISLLLKRFPNVLCNHTGKFNRAVQEVVEMEFNPALFTFAVALKTKINLSKGTWKCKIDTFEKWGISKDEVLAAFRKHPMFMVLSEESINNKINFLVNKMHWQLADVLEQPVVFTYNLEDRIVPRCSVIRVLLLKGLIRNKISLISILVPSDEHFLDKYVTKHKEQVPELLDVFEGKIIEKN